VWVLQWRSKQATIVKHLLKDVKEFGIKALGKRSSLRKMMVEWMLSLLNFKLLMLKQAPCLKVAAAQY
jgi:hypothetical protein